MKKDVGGKTAVRYGKVNVLSNVRSKPSPQGDIVSVMSAGMKVCVLGEDGGYYKIHGGYILKTLVDISGH